MRMRGAASVAWRPFGTVARAAVGRLLAAHDLEAVGIVMRAQRLDRAEVAAVLPVHGHLHRVAGRHDVLG